MSEVPLTFDVGPFKTVTEEKGVAASWVDTPWGAPEGEYWSREAVPPLHPEGPTSLDGALWVVEPLRPRRQSQLDVKFKLSFQLQTSKATFLSTSDLKGNSRVICKKPTPKGPHRVNGANQEIMHQFDAVNAGPMPYTRVHPTTVAKGKQSKLFPLGSAAGSARPDRAKSSMC